MLNHSDSPAFLNTNAIILASEGKHKEAISCFFQGLRLDPENPTLWYNLALSYRAIGELSKAKEALINSIEFDSSDPDALDSMGVILHEIGEDLSAEFCFKKAVGINPDNGRIWNNLGVLYFDRKNYKEAARSFETAVSLLEEDDAGDTLINLRDTYNELGETEKENKCDMLIRKLGIS